MRVTSLSDVSGRCVHEPHYYQHHHFEAALEYETRWPASIKLSPRALVATQAELDFKHLTELVNEPSTKPVLVVKLRKGLGYRDPEGGFSYYILDGHHRVASARLRGVDVEAVVVG